MYEISQGDPSGYKWPIYAYFRAPASNLDLSRWPWFPRRGMRHEPRAAHRDCCSTISPPDMLGGIRVHVRDRSHANDMLAPLVYVSPSQISYILPSTDPFAWVGIERVGSPYVAKGMAVPTDLSALNVFRTLYSVGAGLAMASAERISPDGAVTPIAVTSCGETGCASVPIDLSGDPVYLSLYGSGFAQASPVNASCTIGFTEVPVLYIGPQNQIPGLDQINFLLPKSLAGAPSYYVSCSFDLPQGRTSAGAVFLSIRCSS